MLTGLWLAIGGEVWNTGVAIGIGVSTQSRSLSIWGIVVGFTLWNSKGSTRDGDEWGDTGVQISPIGGISTSLGDQKWNN